MSDHETPQLDEAISSSSPPRAEEELVPVAESADLQEHLEEAEEEKEGHIEKVLTPGHLSVCDDVTAEAEVVDETIIDPDSGEVIGKKVVIEDEREHLNIVFIGHVDAGKSTIAGNILYLTGVVSQRTIEKYSREAKEKNRGTWFLAFIMDTNEEERAKGKTVEVGRAHFETTTKRYTILDAPGHKNYVPNMIGGACQADIGILVISARKGEFETGFEGGGQTREHVTLCKTLGVKKLICVINKMDEPSVLWSEPRYQEIISKLNPFFRSVGYSKSDITFIPVSGYSGSNIMDSVSKEDCPWHDGSTLIGTLDNLEPLHRSSSSPLRIPVLDRYRDRGCTIVLGKIESGTLCVGDTVTVMPNRQTSEILFIELDTLVVKRARAGENVNIGLKDVSPGDISQGFVICGTSNFVPVVSKFIAQLAIIDLLSHKAVMSAGYTAVLHIHTANEEISIGRLLRSIDKKTKEPSAKPPKFVKKGDIVEAVIELSKPICLEDFESFAQLGRFTLRDEGKTIAIGKVLKLPKEAKAAALN